MKYCFNPSPVVALSIEESDLLFPVRRVLCVGLNYADHTKEMGGDPSKEPPFFFAKPNEALIPATSMNEVLSLPYPKHTQSFHHEIELVVAVGKQNSQDDFSTPEKALKRIFGYALGLDMTRRDLQYELKKAGRAWEAAKAFEHSAPISPIVLANHMNSIEKESIALEKNGVVVQQSSLSQLIWNCSQLLVQAAQYFDIQAGDLLFTGTPAGIGPVEVGDRLLGRLGPLRLQVNIT